MKKSMLKKMISILLCMAMLAGLGAAAAEADKTELGSVNVNGKFTLKARLPEGYTVQLRTIDSDKGFLQVTEGKELIQDLGDNVGDNNIVFLEPGNYTVTWDGEAISIVKN